MADVFISYRRSKGTSALVRRIADELKSKGISCWYDTKDPNPGHFADIIEKQIKYCKVFLFIWDIGANESDWCYDEVFTALAYKKLLIPFQLGRFQKRAGLSLRLGSLNIFYGGKLPETAHIGELVNQISRIFNKKMPAKIIKSGNCGKQVTYILDENGVLTISGFGAMQNYHFNQETKVVNSPWWSKRSEISRIRIKNGVTSIGNFAFPGCIELTRIDIPNSVNNIGNYAFLACAVLSSVSISPNVTSIGTAAFSGCEKLPRITIPNKVTSIEPMTFYNCKNLTFIKIPDSVSQIGDSAFSGCTSLIEVNIPIRTRKSIATTAFPIGIKMTYRF